MAVLHRYQKRRQPSSIARLGALVDGLEHRALVQQHCCCRHATFICGLVQRRVALCRYGVDGRRGGIDEYLYGGGVFVVARREVERKRAVTRVAKVWVRTRLEKCTHGWCAAGVRSPVERRGSCPVVVFTECLLERVLTFCFAELRVYPLLISLGTRQDERRH